MVMGYWREWGESSTGDNGVSSSAGEMYKCVMSVCQKDDIHSKNDAWLRTVNAP